MRYPAAPDRNAAILAARESGASVADIALQHGISVGWAHELLRQQAAARTTDDSPLDAAVLAHFRSSTRWSPLDSPEVKRLRANAHDVEARIQALAAAGRIAFGGRPGRFWYVVEG